MAPVATRIFALGALLPGCTALSTSVTRRAVLLSSTAAIMPIQQAAHAWDLPTLEAFDDPKARAAAAKMKNPPAAKQQSSAFYAVSTGDQPSLQAMVDNGWDIATVKDDARYDRPQPQ